MSLDTLTRNFPDPASAGSPPRRRSWAWLLPLALVAGFLLILTLLFGDRLIPALEVRTSRVVTLRSGEVSRTKGEPPQPDSKGEKGGLLFQASGWVEPDPFAVFVPALVNGVVREVHVLEGQVVSKGDLLATLIDEDASLDFREAERKFLSQEKKIEAHCAGFDVLEAELTAARRKVDAVQARLDEAEDAYARLDRLSEGAVSRQQVVQARLATDRERALLAEAKAEIPRLKAKTAQLITEKESMLATLDELKAARDRAQLMLARTRITAPMDGRVLHLHAAPGMKKMLEGESSKSAAIVELYDPEKLQARIDVPLNEAAALRPGLPVELASELLPDTVWSGTVTRVIGQADLQRNTLQAKVAIDDPDPRLRPEMLVRAKFYDLIDERVSSAQAGSGRLSLYVLREAVIDDSFVWVVDSEGRSRKKKVTLGDEEREGHRLVHDGLRSGETVILPPHGDLEEGHRVNNSNPKESQP